MRTTPSAGRTHVLLWNDSTAVYLEAIKEAGLADRITVDTLPRKEKPSAEQLARTEAMMAYVAYPGVLPLMPKLRWVQVMTAGVDNWLALPDLPPALTLSCARGTHTESMPENIVGALFYVAKPYAGAVENQKHRKWVHTVAQPLTGKTLGILGLGAIGQQVARIGSTLGMRVIGTRRRPQPVADVAQVLPPDRTSDVLAQSDFLVLLLPATAETENFINAERLSKMKPGAWLLNFGRGQLVNDNDLVEAVKARRIAGAVLDVFREEPLPANHPFWATDGIIVLPHIGGPHPQRDKFVARLFAENLGRFLDNKPLKEVVDRKAGY
ncbi:MAG TPA: D-2-hydroxyacid dehydrogenase [Burkholderiales bacterium]